MRLQISVRHIRFIAATIAVVSLVLVGLGGFVRGTGAGLSCPDWPLCYGRAVPHDFSGGVAQEVGHRYLASIVSFGTMIFALLAWINRRAFPKLWTLMKVALAILGLQVILGGLTVLMQLNPFIVTAHLVFGTFFFQLMALIALERIPRPSDEQELKLVMRMGQGRGIRLYQMLVVTAFLIFAQIILGGFVGSSGASVVCPDLLYCTAGPDREQSSALSGAQIIHMTHRVLGFSIVALLMYVAARARSLSDGIQRKKGHLFGLAALGLLQIALGLFNVYWRIPVGGAVAHLILAQFILLGTLHFLRRYRAGASVFLHSERANREIEFGEYTPTKRRFAANLREAYELKRRRNDSSNV